MRAIAVLMLVCGVLGCAREAREVPVSDAALSYFEETPEGCAWKRVEPVLGRTDTLATLSMEKCDLMSIAWSSDGKRALLASPMGVYLWKTGSPVEPFSVPSPGTRVLKISFDADGEPDVTLRSTAEPCGEEDLRGKDVPPSEFDCLSAAPHASEFPRLRPVAFEAVSDDELLYLLETTAPWEPPTWITTSDAQGNAVGVPEGLDMADVIAVYAEYNRKRHSGHPARLATEIARKEGKLAWGAVRLPSGLVAAHRDGTLVFVTPQRATILAEGAPIVDEVWFRGDHLLVLESNGTFPRLYDAGTGRRVWDAKSATAASFWPKLATASK